MASNIPIGAYLGGVCHGSQRRATKDEELSGDRASLKKSQAPLGAL